MMSIRILAIFSWLVLESSLSGWSNREKEGRKLFLLWRLGVR